PAAPMDTTDHTHPVTYHIGGYGGMTSPTINNIKTITVDFPAEVQAEVREAHGSGGPNIHLHVDALKLFTGTEDVDFNTNHTVMHGSYSTTIANNYANMFRVDHIHNHSH